MHSSRNIRAPSSSSSEDICWERKRTRGGYEPNQKEKNDSSDSDVVHFGSGRRKKSRPTRREHIAQDVSTYYKIKEWPVIGALAGNKEDPKGNKSKGKDKDEPPVYPEDKPKEHVHNDYDENVEFSDHVIIYIIIGYLTGISLVLCWYVMNYETAGRDLNLRWFLFVLLVLLILMLCYSHTTRCIGALMLLHLSGYRGRLLFIAWAFYLALIGPVMNIIRNIDIMIHSLACGQGLLLHALTPMHQIMGEPVYIVEQSVYNCLSQVRKLMEHLDDVLLRLESPIVELYSNYKSCGDWLRHQQNFFDNQMGTPYDRCMGAGSISVQECHTKLNGDKSACDIEKRFDWFCANLKDLGSFFDPYMHQHQEIAEQMFTRPLEAFDKIRSIFEVSITFDHVQKSADDNNKSISDIELQIGNQFDLEMKKFILSFIWLGVVIFVVLIVVFLAALYFRINYLDCENYRNIYLTKEFYDYNSQEYTKLGYSALPMRPTERYKYCKIFDRRYLPVEVKCLKNSLMFMLITGLQIFIICIVDISLFWMLAIMSYHSHQTAEPQPPQYTKIQVEGGGMIGFILRGLVKAFEPLSKNLFADIQHCLPLPGPPKYLRYWEIMMIYLLTWLFLIFEPYFLRARHLIMSRFYPDNARKRGEYLHGRLLLEREIFILESRRKVRAVNTFDPDKRSFQTGHYFKTALYWITCGRFGARHSETCIICHSSLTSTEAVKCETQNCRGVFCQTCFIESNCHCILCNPPTVYGDYTSYSEIEDSSDDPECSFTYRPHNISCARPPTAQPKKMSDEISDKYY
ncbi:hypothetical protein ACLKA6_011288 [Drosophila palustris]